MKRTITLLALAVALGASPAYAATDTSGMRYTSAAEGFYASIRVRLNSGDRKIADLNIENSASRIGLRGSSDIGRGKELFYQYEMGVDIDNGGSISTRLGHVGMRGGFGMVQAGAFWVQSYNWVHGSTDVAAQGTGNYIYNNLHPGRESQAIEYTTPEMDGFQGAILAVMDDTSKAAVPATTTLAIVGSSVTVSVIAAKPAVKDQNGIDKWIAAARFDVRDFSAGASYTFIPEGLDEDGGGKANHFAYAVKLGYARNNWRINGWYSRDNSSDGKAKNIVMRDSGGNTVTVNVTEDVEVLSFAGVANFTKFDFYVMHELREHLDENGESDGRYDDKRQLFGITYRFNGKSRAWIDYIIQDNDADEGAVNYLAIGLRHDF